MSYGTFMTKKFSAIMFGIGIRKSIGNKLVEKKVSKALIITDSYLYEAGMVDDIVKSIKSAGIEVAVYAGAKPENPDEIVEECAEFARKESVNAFVGVGGGSVLDLAKTARILMANPSPIETYYDMKVHRITSNMPMILVPTTAGTSSEISHGAMVYDTKNGVKRGFTGDDLAATIACVDPELCKGMPARITAVVGFDCLCHVAEAMTCGMNTNPLTIICGQAALKLVRKSLLKAIEDGSDMEARNNMSLACVFAGIAFESCPPHVGHSLGHTVGAMYHVPHGEACGVFLAPVMELSSQTKSYQVKLIGEALGVAFDGTETDVIIGRKTADAIRELYRKTGCRNMREIVLEKDVEKIAEMAASDPSMRVSPVPITNELICDMIRSELARNSETEIL